MKWTLEAAAHRIGNSLPVQAATGKPCQVLLLTPPAGTGVLTVGTGEASGWPWA